MHAALPTTVLLASVLAAPAPGQSNDWPAWRGPTGDGHAASEARPPLEWSEERGVRWKTALPGLGASTPVVHGDRLFLTCAVLEDGGGVPEGEEVPPPAREPHRLLVLAYDRATGELLWETAVGEATPPEGLHRTSTLASASATTDGERVYASFGSHGVHALDLEGELVWSRDLGEMEILADFGEGATPVLAGDSLVVPWDHEGDSALIALDARSGEVRWRRAREGDSSWGSPVVFAVGESAQVITSGSDATRAYDLADGTPLWSCGGMSKNPVSSPTVAGDLLFVMNSYRGTIIQALRFVGARGEIGDSDRVAWAHSKSASYVPNPVVVEGHLFFLRDSKAILSCLDAQTGEERFYGQRIDGLDDVHASPVAAAGRLYIASRNGAVAVVAARPAFEPLALSELDDSFDASPVIVGNELFLRGRRSLYCIAEAK